MKNNNSMIKKNKSVYTLLGIYLVATLAIAPLHAMKQTPTAMHIAAASLFVCKTCKKDFTHESILRAHEQNHTGETIKPYACHYPDCSYACRRPIDLVSHERRTHPKNSATPNCHPCTFPGCRCICVGEYNLTRHIHHDHTRLNPISAANTTQKASQEPTTAITALPAEESALYACTHCGNNFTYASTLTVHKKNLASGKPYVCTYPDCGYTTNTPGSLDSHTQTHPHGTTQKTYPCSFAGCRCIHTSSASLARHTNRDHTNAYNSHTEQTPPAQHALKTLQERTSRKRETPELTGAMPPMVKSCEPARGESPYLHKHSSHQSLCAYAPDDETFENEHTKHIVEPHDALSSPESFLDTKKLETPENPWGTHESWF